LAIVVLFKIWNAIVAAITVPYYSVIAPVLLFATRWTTNAVAFIYYNILLLRIPSFACFRCDLEDLFDQIPFADACGNDAWAKLVSMLKSGWAKSDIDCRIILSYVLFWCNLIV
jgi:hypothetical protein